MHMGNDVPSDVLVTVRALMSRSILGGFAHPPSSLSHLLYPSIRTLLQREFFRCLHLLLERTGCRCPFQSFVHPILLIPISHISGKPSTYTSNTTMISSLSSLALLLLLATLPHPISPSPTLLARQNGPGSPYQCDPKYNAAARKQDLTSMGADAQGSRISFQHERKAR